MSAARDGKVCAVYYCQNYAWQRDSFSMFRFPRDNSTCTEWVNKCRRADLDDIFRTHGPEKLNKSYRICAKHFMNTDFRNPNLPSQGLRAKVVPSLFLSPPDVPLPIKRCSPKKRCRKDENEVAVEQKILESAQKIHGTPGRQAIMAETVFIKSEPTWMSDAEETPEVDPTLKADPDAMVDVKTEEEEACIDPEATNDLEDCALLEPKVELVTEQDSTATNVAGESGAQATNPNEDNGKTSQVSEAPPKPKSKRKAHLCHTCGREFKRVDCYRKHEMRHSGLKPHKCEVCGKAFTENGHLKMHQRIHSGVRPYTCPVCNKTFRQRPSLNHHMSVHSDVKQYSCRFCDRSYARVVDLNIHEDSHSGNGRFSCDVCGRCFLRAWTLKHHLLIHTGEKPHSCRVCGQSFRLKQSLDSHMWKHKKEEDASSSQDKLG